MEGELSEWWLGAERLKGGVFSSSYPIPEVWGSYISLPSRDYSHSGLASLG
jgi:hypothetical protein